MKLWENFWMILSIGIFLYGTIDVAHIIYVYYSHKSVLSNPLPHYIIIILGNIGLLLVIVCAVYLLPYLISSIKGMR